MFADIGCVFFRSKAACRRLGGYRCTSVKAPGAGPVVCAGNDVGSVAEEAGVAVVADERPDVGSNRVVAASASESVVVSGVLTEGGDGCWHACNRFGDVVVVKATPLVGGSSGSATSPGGMG